MQKHTKVNLFFFIFYQLSFRSSVILINCRSINCHSSVGPLPCRIEVIRDFLTPDSRFSLQRFLGMRNFYHRFLLAIASRLASLCVASAGRGKELAWTTECQDFRQLADDQAALQKIAAYRTAITNLALQDIAFGDASLLCNMFPGKPKRVELQSFPSYTFISSRRTTPYLTGNCRPLCMARTQT